MSHKTIIITGASSGIGKATKELMDDEYDIMDISRTSGFDLSKLEWEIEDRNVCGLVNNAAVCIKKPITELNMEEIIAMINVNFIAPFLLSRQVLPKLKKNNGSIVNISSVHSHATIKDNSVYAATKAGLESLTRSMAIEFTPVRVNCVRPGSTMTKMLPYEKDMEKDIPLKRIAKPMEIAKVIRFLLSEDSSYITGEVITVDGGLLSKLAVRK